MIKRCARCGCEFDGHGNSLYCDKCREIVRREARLRWKKANPEKQREYQRRCAERQKLKLIREILSTAKELTAHENHRTDR